MFGYVRPFKPELKINEYEVYKGVYCGLCKELGRGYGQLWRFSLSYDFAFFAALSLAVHDTPVEFARQRCIAHPLHKRPCLCCCGDLSYVAASAIAMLYYKWQDNLADSGFWKRLLLRLFGFPVRRAYRKAIRRYPALEPALAGTIGKQQEVEQDPACSFDRAAEGSSRALALLFEALTDDPGQKKVLHRFGFLLGRWVYLVDAVDDLADDRENGSFNPLLLWAKTREIKEEELIPTIRQHAEELLNVTYAEMALAYELIECGRYQSILQNILYLGLPSVKNEVWSDRRKKRNDRSL